MVTVAEVFDSGVEEPVYNCAVAEYHTYFVGGEVWGFSVWAHNTGCSTHSRILRRTINAAIGAGRRIATFATRFASHLVPTGNWARRGRRIASMVRDLQGVLNEAGIGLDHEANGFFTNSGRHLGTHTNRFIEFLHGRVMPLAGNRAAIIQALRQITADLLARRIRF
jgi:hypothetical protein